MQQRHHFSLAARFWQVAPWELEARADSQYWINEALMIQSGENLGQEIAMDIARKKNG